ncbi:carbohydrate ABC transporter permease [Cohnella sp. GCM10020058]|uniref:carbohydrate ABC transporter permease n=1 Tax=Cohnella sp. GCM10020058 TaxID=3317330 RepID=UPI0036456E86
MPAMPIRTPRGSIRNGSGRDRAFAALMYAVVIVFAIVCLLPFWLIVVNSFNSEKSILLHGFQLFPRDYTLYAYRFLFAGSQVFRSYGISLLVTGLGSIAALTVSAMFAYGLAHRKVRYRNVFGFLTYFTMLFGAGIVGFYILIANWLHLKDTIWAMILPYLLNPFFVFVLVSYFRTLPYELNESATVDGANDLRIFFRIVCPISMPALATVGLFYAVQYWNDFYLALLFVDDYKLQPLQFMIRQLMSNIDAQRYLGAMNGGARVAVPTNGVQLATACVTIGPIVLCYPFLQKYYVRGMTIGAVKG